MSKRRFTKQEGQRKHALRRARERYGKFFSGADLRAMKTIIQRGQSYNIRKLTNSRMQHTLMYQGEEFVVCYDKSRGTICTFLPKEK